MMRVREQNVYANHEEIKDFIKTTVSGNMKGGEAFNMHAREILDDIIHDLTDYRDTLATCDQYLKKNLL